MEAPGVGLATKMVRGAVMGFVVRKLVELTTFGSDPGLNVAVPVRETVVYEGGSSTTNVPDPSGPKIALVVGPAKMSVPV